MSLPQPSKNFSTQPSPENSARKRPVSERKVQANRRNALRATGPKTVRGKRTVARNAIKHGLLAREVVITAGDGEENLEEFHALIDRTVGILRTCWCDRGFARTNDCHLLVEESPCNSC